LGGFRIAAPKTDGAKGKTNCEDSLLPVDIRLRVHKPSLLWIPLKNKYRLDSSGFSWNVCPPFFHIPSCHNRTFEVLFVFLFFIMVNGS
jgi:hypothetical protein